MEKVQSREPWNKGKLIGQKPPLKLKGIWAIHSKLRGCDLVHKYIEIIRALPKTVFDFNCLEHAPNESKLCRLSAIHNEQAVLRAWRSPVCWSHVFDTAQN